MNHIEPCKICGSRPRYRDLGKGLGRIECPKGCRGYTVASNLGGEALHALWEYHMRRRHNKLARKWGRRILRGGI